MAKRIEPLKDAPELPEEVAGPIEPEEVLELNDKVEGPIDDKLADLLEETVQEDETESSGGEQAEEDTVPNTESDDEAADQAPKTADAEEDGLPDDPVTDAAIDDIVAEEGDAVLAAEDKERGAAEESGKTAKKPGRLKKLIRSIWEDPRRRWAFFGGLTVLVLALTLIPHSRYFILNTTGVRASMNLRVIDSGTLQPLKNVSVTAGGARAMTDSDGVAKLQKVRLGRTELKIEKRAFSPQKRAVTVGWGSNPLGDFQATAVGSQYVFYAKDAFSGQPLSDAEAASGEGNAHADEDGKLVLTLDTADQDDAAQLSVQISSDGYRTETINITVNNKETQEVQMVPSRRHVFVSKRSGNYDVYAVYADGREEQRIVGGTGLERDDIVLVPHQTANVAALVATRENTRNPSGYLLSTLYIVNTQDGDLMKIDQSEQIRIVGWSGSRLVYVKIAAGASGTDPKRHRLMSFNNDEDATKELASSNYFNDVIMADGKVYYAPSNIFQESSPGMYAVNADGGSQQTILDQEVYTIVRGGFDSLFLSAGNEWYQYTLGSPLAAKAQAPSSQTGRIYADNPAGKFSLWVDGRDGKGVLISYDKTTKEEKTLVQRGGLKLPVYWLNDKYIVFRVSDGKEIADYAMNIMGGEPRKITDVTDTAGIGRWLYY